MQQMVELRFCREVMGPGSHTGSRRGVTFTAGKGIQPHCSLPAPLSLSENEKYDIVVEYREVEFLQEIWAPLWTVW